MSCFIVPVFHPLLIIVQGTVARIASAQSGVHARAEPIN